MDNQLIVGLVITLIGAGVAAWVHRTVGLVVAGIGVLVMLLSLLGGLGGGDTAAAASLFA